MDTIRTRLQNDAHSSFFGRSEPDTFYVQIDHIRFSDESHIFIIPSVRTRQEHMFIVGRMACIMLHRPGIMDRSLLQRRDLSYFAWETHLFHVMNLQKR